MGLSTHSDSELITQTLCLDPPGGKGGKPDWPARIRHLMALTPLAYSLLIMDDDRIYGVRDLYGNRPLCLGRVVPEGECRRQDRGLHVGGLTSTYPSGSQPRGRERKEIGVAFSPPASLVGQEDSARER